MNKLMAFILSLTLICWQIHIPAAMAVDRSQKESTETSASANTSGKTLIETDDYISSLIMIGTGIIAMTLIAKCPTFSYDTALVALGGAAYIFGEIQSIKAYKDYKEDMHKDYLIKKGEDNSSQIQELQKMKAMYEAVLDAAEQKQMMQRVAGGAWALAAGVSLGSYIANESLRTSCVTAINTDVATCSTLVTVDAPSMSAAIAADLESVVLEHTRNAISEQKPTSSAVDCSEKTASDTLKSTAFGTAITKAGSACIAEYEVEANAKSIPIVCTGAACGATLLLPPSVAYLGINQAVAGYSAGVCPTETSACTAVPAAPATCTAAITACTVGLAAPVTADATKNCGICAAKIASTVAATCTPWLTSSTLQKTCCMSAWVVNNQNPVIKFIAENPRMMRDMIGKNWKVDEMSNIFNMQKFNFSPSYVEFLSKNVEKEKTRDVNRYANFHERQRILKFENKTIGIDDYQNLEKSFDEIESVYGAEYSSTAIDLAISQGIDLIVPSAHANPMSFWTKTAGLGVAAVGILLGWLVLNWQIYDTFMGSPGKRAIAFGLMSTLAFTQAGDIVPNFGTQAIIDKMKSNISKIDAVLSQMRVASGSANKINNTAIPGGKTGTGFKNGPGGRIFSTGVAVSDDPKETFPCVAPGENGKCGKISGILSSKFSELNGLNMGGFAEFSSSLGKFGDGISGQSKVSAATLNEGASLAQNAANLRKFQLDNENKLNEARKKDGLEQIDFKKQRENLFNKLFKNTKTQFGNVSDKSALASLMGNLDKGGNTSGGAEANKAAGNAYGGSGFKAPGFSMPAMPKMNFKTVDEEKKEEAVAVVDEKVAGLDQYEDNSIDIVKGPDVSIFTVISTRYFKSGWDRLMERETVKPPLALPVKK